LVKLLQIEYNICGSSWQKLRPYAAAVSVDHGERRDTRESVRGREDIFILTSIGMNELHQ